ncbi:hypothetical protein [Nocardia sp. SYP-A9097]|nr:hypothetical protein [Nocardia sp. SYP-A9097]
MRGRGIGTAHGAPAVAIAEAGNRDADGTRLATVTGTCPVIGG